MGRENKDVVVDGTSYVVVPFSATKGLRISCKLIQLLGESAFKAMAMGMSVSAETMMASVGQGLFDKFSPDVVDSIVKEVLSGTLEQNTVVANDFDNRFSGNQFHMWKVVVASVRAQFGDFAEGFQALKSLPQKTKSK